jgi:hypothetical protein
MEEYKKSMESQSITTPTEKTPQQIEEDKNKKDMEAMEEMITEKGISAAWLAQDEFI